MKNVFSIDELNALEALQIKGGAAGNPPDSPNAQTECVNTFTQCGATADQTKCVNSYENCGGTQPLVNVSKCNTGGPK